MAVEVFANLATTSVLSGGGTAPVSGTTETWTVSSSASFPAVSNSATPPTQIHVADISLNSEIILVTNISGTTWSVTRGAEGTTPVSHAAGFVVYQVTTAGFLTSPSVAGLMTANGYAVTANATLPGSTMGLDAPFGATPLRVVNLNTNGAVQVVASGTGDVEFWVNGTEVVHVANAGLFATATGSGHSGAITTNDITVQPNSGISSSASMFLDNTNPLPVNQHGVSDITSTTTTLATPSKTPSLIGCLALAAMTYATNGNTVSGVSSGWTLDGSENSTYHGIFIAHKNALTTDTSTAISNTFTMGTTTQGITEIVLLAPSPGGSPSIVQTTGVAISTNPTIAFSLASTPAAGNLLVAFVAYSMFDGANSIPTPAGWTLVDSASDGNPSFDGLATFWRIVQAGDGKNWSFTQAVTGDWCSGAMYEVTQVLTVSQTWEFFNNVGGQFGVYDKTYGVQPITVSPAPNGFVSIAPGGNGGSFSVNASSVTLATTAGDVSVQPTGGGFRCHSFANFFAGLQLQRTSVNHAASPYSISSTGDYILGCDPSGGVITVTLPNIGWTAQTYVVKDETGNAAAHNITVAGSGGQLIDGASTYVINSNYGSMTFYSNGTGWSTAQTQPTAAMTFAGEVTALGGFTTDGSVFIGNIGGTSVLGGLNLHLGLDVSVAGNGLSVAEGSNAKQGTAVLSAGSKVVSNTSVTANSRIFLTSQVDGGSPGWLRVSARTAGTSFTITSSSGTDTSTVAYEIFEPG